MTIIIRCVRVCVFGVGGGGNGLDWIGGGGVGRLCVSFFLSFFLWFALFSFLMSFFSLGSR